jgi:hypothetical protein
MPHDLVVDLDPKWAAYIKSHGIRVFYEVWQPGGADVFCFDPDGLPRLPYERAGLDMIPVVRAEMPTEGEPLLFKGSVVARFPDFVDGVCFRVIMHLHKQPDRPKERVPHHVATALLTVDAAFASALYRHGDIGWMDVPVCGTASLGPKPRSPDPFYSPHAITDRLVRVFNAAILPDFNWLKSNTHRMHEYVLLICR